MSSSLEEQFNTLLKDAMRKKDQKVLNVIRQVKTKVTEKKTASGFSGKVDDALWTDVILSYVKSLKKAQSEFAKAGDKASERIEELEFEITYLSPFLPKAKSEDEVRKLVKEKIDQLGITDKKQAGRIIGVLMKEHKGQVEAAMIKRLTEEML